MTTLFKDHFSAQTDDYARYRPTYPDELFHFLAEQATATNVAWDCATGNGQAARALTNYFSEVIATDASRSQIEAALAHPGVTYRTAMAERSGLVEQSVDIVTVGQAFHWFDQDAFFAEVHRVLQPDGLLAIWCYEICHVERQCDALIDHLYRDIVGEYWPPERLLIEQGYDGVELPGEVIVVPAMQMTANWSAADMLGYLRTWSACKRYQGACGEDPVLKIDVELRRVWGTGERRVEWPLTLKVSRQKVQAYSK